MIFKKYNPLKENIFQILNQDGKIVNKEYEPMFSDSQLLEIYRDLVSGRVADLKAVQFQRQGRMLTYVPNQGQEAAQIGPMLAVNKTDWLVPGFREINALLHHGVSLEQAFLYWYGNERGNKFDDDVRVLPINIIIGSQISQAAGLAYARKIKKTDEVVLTFIGDGGTGNGEFYEGLNFGTVLDVPMVVIIQNNQWAISTPISKATKTKNLAQKSIAFGIPGILVDGNDVFAMYVATQEAVKRARKGGGPTLIEALTYRIGAHTTSDNPSIYRKDEETEYWIKRDPITRFRIYLTEKGLWDDEKEEHLQNELNEFVLETFKKVEAEGKVSLEEIFKYTYEDLTLELEEQYLAHQEYLKSEVE
ncbi:MAG: pyruvate dehydrogenase (acetyl-transferring) E1 component subunit alpha [Bacilli bacterium]|nr:pyruvate dehydrogenase (acetyl-transferring) E1 component subunit alpha [Bacilli bacterium]